MNSFSRSYINILYPAVYIGQAVLQFQISTASFTKVRFSSKPADFQFNKNIIIGSATTFSMNVLFPNVTYDLFFIGRSNMGPSSKSKRCWTRFPSDWKR